MPERTRRSPTSLTPELATRLVELLRYGNFVHVACEAVGIDRRTYSRWMQRGLSGRTRDRAFRELREQVVAARAEAETRLVQVIANADDWRAASWLLERGWSERWGKPSERERVQVVEVTVPESEPEPVDPFEEVDELAEKRRVSGRPV